MIITPAVTMDDTSAMCGSDSLNVTVSYVS